MTTRPKRKHSTDAPRPPEQTRVREQRDKAFVALQSRGSAREGEAPLARRPRRRWAHRRTRSARPTRPCARRSCYAPAPRGDPCARTLADVLLSCKLRLAQRAPPARAAGGRRPPSCSRSSVRREPGGEARRALGEARSRSVSAFRPGRSPSIDRALREATPDDGAPDRPDQHGRHDPKAGHCRRGRIASP